MTPLIRKKARQVSHSVNLATLAKTIQDTMRRNSSAALRVGGVYQIRIAGVRELTIDLSANHPNVFEGSTDLPIEVSVELAEADLQKLLFDPQETVFSLIHKSQLKVNGNNRALSKLVRILQLR